MPNSSHNAASAAPKRPGLGRRAISSHAVITRANSSGSGDLSDPSSSTHSHKPHHVSRHHHPRPHLVGHRHHHVRNPSHGKNANKLQRLNSGLPDAGKTQGRKKSAPTTPAASPPRGGGAGGHHVRWEGETEEPEAHLKESVKKNYSSPALRRTHFTNGGSKKTFASERPLSSSGKKTVGFELGDSENDDGEWEDTTQSPESTRRSSVVQSRDSADNAAALVDPLIFVKRPVPHMPRASSLPEPRSSKTFSEEGHLKDEDDDDDGENKDDDTDDNIEEAKQNAQKSQEKEQEQLPQLEQQHEQQGQEQENAEEEKRPQEQRQQENESSYAPESSAIASRLLSPSLSAKAPPAMSSISALAKPAASDVHIPPNTSLNSLASGQDGTRRTVSSSTQLANTPGNQTQATSSSIEGGVSRFIVDNSRAAHQPSYKTDSDPNTPSSFLPHYHPNTPPSPKGTSQKPKASPPSRPPGSEPPSRTQQKLWLQRTAALNTSPPDNHGSGTGSPSTMDPAYMATARPGSSPYDTRGLANGAVRASGSGHDSEAKQTRKAYEKTALELDVVRRFQSPTADSFSRLRSFIHETKAHERRASLTKSVQSAPSLPALRDGQQQSNSSQTDTTNESRQLAGRQMPESSSTQSVSQGYTQDADESSVTASDGDHGNAQKSPHPSHRILSSSDDTAHGNSSAEEDKTEYVNEAEMMVRRLWDTRIVATSA